MQTKTKIKNKTHTKVINGTLGQIKNSPVTNAKAARAKSCLADAPLWLAVFKKKKKKYRYQSSPAPVFDKRKNFDWRKLALPDIPGLS